MRLARLSALALIASAIALATAGCRPAPVPTCNFNDSACIHQVMGY